MSIEPGIVRLSSRAATNRHRDETPKLGLRLENHSVQLVVARPLGGEDGRGQSAGIHHTGGDAAPKYELTFDRVASPKGISFLTGGDPGPLSTALEELGERHPLRRHPLAISLDGDFCVTRVTMTSQQEMPRKLGLLNERVNHYLQLGPGKKVTGGFQTALDERTQYAATSVVSLRLIETLYDAFRRARLTIAWVEPSLISMARLVGRDRRYNDKTVMIADGTGERWDIGIAGNGRLWLDYRPAGAESREGVHRALDGHLERLQRFCRRHRKISSTLMSDLLVCGSGPKASAAVELLRGLEGLHATVFQIDCLDDLLQADQQPGQTEDTSPSGSGRSQGRNEDDRGEQSSAKASPKTSAKAKQGRVSADGSETRHSQQAIEPEKVPVVSALLPLLLGTERREVPDMLEHVRRETPKSTLRLLIGAVTPVLAASLLAVASLSYHGSVRDDLQKIEAQAASMQSLKSVRQVRNEELLNRTKQIANFERLAEVAKVDNPMNLFDDVTKCLPPNTRLLSWSVFGNHRVTLQGETQDESNLYDTIETLQRVPRVDEVNVVSTEPTADLRGGRFVLNLWVKDRSGKGRRDGEEDATATDTSTFDNDRAGSS